MDETTRKNLFNSLYDILISNKETYSLSIITRWLNEKQIEFKYHNPAVISTSLINHGIHITIKNKNISIQTHPTVAGWAFAETCCLDDIQNEKRHETPEKLFEYLESI